MSSARTFISLPLAVLAFCLFLAEGFAQERIIVSPFSESRIHAPRYNLSVGYSNSGISSFQLKHVTGKAQYRLSNQQMTLSYEHFLHTFEFFKNDPFWAMNYSIYWGVQAGYEIDHCSHFDILSIRTAQAVPQYAKLGVYLGLVESLFYIRLGYNLLHLTTASIDSATREMMGFNQDCFTHVRNELQFEWGLVLGRLYLAMLTTRSFSPVFSVNALEYYNGESYTCEVPKKLTGFKISFVFGGTDR